MNFKFKFSFKSLFCCLSSLFRCKLHAYTITFFNSLSEKSYKPVNVSGFCHVCLVFPPHVSIFGLFPVLVKCHSWSTGREPSCPPIAGDIRRRRWLSQARRRVAYFPGCRSPRRAVRGRSRHRIAADSMPAGPPLTQCPPDRLWLKPAGSPLTHACRIAADSSPPDWRWLMPAGRREP